MNNVKNIARSEFANLIQSRLVWLVGAIYLLLVIHELIYFRPPGDPMYANTLNIIRMANHVSDTDYFTFVLLKTLAHIFLFYGAFFGIIMGVFSLELERYGNTLNNLATKPLYRDTIINGKLLGSLFFVLTVFVLTIILFTSLVIVMWGTSFVPLAAGYLIRLPIVALLSLVYVLVFFLAAMLISLLVRDLAFALILSVMGSVMLDTVPFFAVKVFAPLLGWNASINPLASATPFGILEGVFGAPVQTDTILTPSMDLMKALSAALPDIALLFVYMVILAFACYTVFVRRDIA